MSYRDSFEKYIDSFLTSFSIYNVEKYYFISNKNAKYLFYRFNDYKKSYGNKRKRIKHTQKIKNSVGLHKIEKKGSTTSY